MSKLSNLILTLVVIICIGSSLDPLRQIQLYPNTQNSDSIYIFSFKLQKNIPAGSYILINLDWYASALLPYRCIMVNTSIQLSCTNFLSPQFPLSITVSQLKEHNQYLTQARTVAVLLGNNLLRNTQYNLQLHLYNIVPNIRKISPSAEIYVVSKQGLVYEQNINYGPAINRPPIDIVLYMSVLNNMALNKPGQLSNFKAEFKISQPIETDLSAFMLVLHYPFSFTQGSLPKSYASSLSATSSIALYSKPTISEYKIISQNIFYVVFAEKFIADRRFILEVTQIKNPFYLAQSNISIYSMNYNSLTPLEGYEHGYTIQTVSFPMVVTLGMPFDQQQTGPRAFYKNTYQYVKVDITIPKSVPAGYSIRFVLTGGTITQGTAFANFQTLDFDPIYEYGTTYFIIKNLGSMLIGSKIQTTVQILKNIITGFSFDVYIDTSKVINTFVSARYMYEGRAQGVSITKNIFLNGFRDSVFGVQGRISHDVLPATQIVIVIYPQAAQDTSAGAFLQIYLSPNFIVDDDFSTSNDCSFNNVALSATCTRERTSSHIKLTIKYIDPLVNPLPKQTYTTITINNVFPPRSTSNKFIYPCYLTLYKTGAVGAAEYYDTRIITVMPKYNGLLKLQMEQHNNMYDSDFTYPGFLRVESTVPTQMNYIIQENEIRVITLVSRYGFKGMGAIKNQESYPCTSNIQVKCTYLSGHQDFPGLNLQHILQWDRIVISFPNNQQNSKIFHVIVPDSVRKYNWNYFYHFVGVYNKLTKDYKYYYMKNGFYRTSWPNNVATVLKTALYVDFGGRAGSYKNNVTISIENTRKYTSGLSFLCISTSWPFYERAISSINPISLAVANPKLGINQSQPISVYMSQGMYLTLIPIKYITSSVPDIFTIMLDNVHMPYDYDLPSYYIYFIDSGNSPNGNQMSASNQFIMTNANIFYECPLKALTIECRNNALGVKNTICTIVFGTQNPLKADGKVRLSFSGMTVATNVCEFYHSNGTLLPSTCSSTADNKNLTISLSGWQHYPAGNFTLKISGVGIQPTQISQSFTLYLLDPTAKYIIQRGNRILTTTIAKQKVIEVYQILYAYDSPLAYNKMSIRFYLPRQIYNDEEFGFVMGKDLSDVNTEIKRLNIKLTKSGATGLQFLYRLISSQYKVMFTFDDPSQLTEGNYTLEIYGVRTPTSHENGDFNIIFQRKHDKKFSLINQISSSFPALRNYVISDMTLASYFNTEGYDQQIEITIKNRGLPVNDKMVWIINFPSYYSPLVFNYKPYCLIDGSPIQCHADPDTPYQLIIQKSPRIIAATIAYKIQILGIACPRVQYMTNKFPNRYIFIGILQTSLSDHYEQTNLIYPQQDVHNYISGIIGIQNIQVASTQLTSFYNVYMIVVLKCNVNINSGEYLYLVFPPEFDNFNNKPLNVIIKTTSVIGTFNAPILDRRIEIQMPANVPLNTQLKIQMTNVPTPTKQVSSQMSKIVSFVTLADKSKITAASATSGNSAPKLTFTKDTRYISFNNDQAITITAGTYSQPIYIKSSDTNPFLTNVKVSLTSAGFSFQPAQLLLKLGDQKAQFRISADKDLHPISYFYSATKQQQIQTFYKITTNNNIRITNAPVSILIPSAIPLPVGGCSKPFTIQLLNPPSIDMSITFNYNNSQFNENVFYPNPHTTKSSLKFTKYNTNNTLSFCTAANITGTQIKVKLVLTGTNYKSYTFSPSDVITFNLVVLTPLPIPLIQLQMINQQKTFVDFNLTLNTDGIVFYELFIGDSTDKALSAQALQVYIKNQVANIQSNKDFMSSLYLTDRDQRVGQTSLTAGQQTLRFNDMLPQTSYVFCTYLQNKLRVLKGPYCQVIQTQNWGQLKVMKVKFSKSISDFQLNKVMCFFTKYLSTKTAYLINSQGASCNDNAVMNTNFNYQSTTFTNHKKSTNIYLATNPYLTSDPSPVAFSTMFDTGNALTNAVLASALSGYGIDFMSGTYVKTLDARQQSSRWLAQSLSVSFDKPTFVAATHKITVQNIYINTHMKYGAVYFLLVLYKQFITNPSTNETSVKIRLNTAPTPYQVINCINWQNITAEGCTRAVFSGDAVKIQLSGIQQDSMYLLYYMVANQYPFRPVTAFTVQYQTIVTLKYAFTLLGQGLLLLILLFILLG